MNWMIFAGLSAASAGLIPILARRDAAHVDATLATAIRSLVMAGSLVIAAALLGRFRQLPSLDRPALLAISLNGLACAASWFFYFLALHHGPASKVVAIDRTSVAFTLVLAALFLGEALTWRSALGVGMILGGTFVALRG